MSNDSSDIQERIGDLEDKVSMEVDRLSLQLAKYKKRVNDLESKSDQREKTIKLLIMFDDSPSVRSRKVTILDHLRDKARKKSSGKTTVDTDTISTICDMTPRQSLNYIDDLAGEVPGCSVVKESNKEGKKLRFDISTFDQGMNGIEAETLL